MAYAHVCFAADENVAVLVVQVGEEIECEDYGAVGAVFKGHNATVCATILYRGEDILDGGLGCESVCVWRKGVEGCLAELLG